jgi:ADP-heptose:LPS heptosyltransferase
LAQEMKILIFKFSPIGDTVMFLPVLQELRRLKPDWEITVCTTPACAGLFAPQLDRRNIWAEDREVFRRSVRRPFSLLAWVRRVRGLWPDAVLLSFDQSSMARILASCSGAGLRIGGADSAVRWKGGLTHEVRICAGQTLAKWEWEMARVLSLGTDLKWPENPPTPRLPFPNSPANRGRPRVLVHAGASRAYQRWDAARYVELAERLAADFDVMWILQPGDDAPKPNPPVTCVLQTDLIGFVFLAESADLFVGNHSGPFHLASAAGTPCVIPTGPTLQVCDPPWNEGTTRLLRMQGLSCMPCDKLIVSPNRCTHLSEPMACLKYWTVDAVEQVCRSVLARKAGNRS